MATAAEKKAAAEAEAEKAAASGTAPDTGDTGDEAGHTPAYYIATRDLYIAGVPAHRIGDTVPAEHVERYGWKHSVAAPEEGD